MRLLLLLVASLAVLLPAAAATREPLVHTYSIVARDPATGELGVAVQSHWFQVGAVVPWAEAGLGAVATQSIAEPAYGPRGLELLRQGKSAQEALDALVAADPQRDVRQVAMIDLRVDDHPQPLVELRRLLGVHRAYDEMNAGDEAMAKNDLAAALAHYSWASELAPEIVELPFWQAVTLFAAGQEEKALPIFARVFAAEERWRRLVPKLSAAGLLPDDPAKIARIVAAGPAAGP